METVWLRPDCLSENGYGCICKCRRWGASSVFAAVSEITEEPLIDVLIHRAVIIG